MNQIYLYSTIFCNSLSLDFFLHLMYYQKNLFVISPSHDIEFTTHDLAIAHFS